MKKRRKKEKKTVAQFFFYLPMIVRWQKSVHNTRSAGDVGAAAAAPPNSPISALCTISFCVSRIRTQTYTDMDTHFIPFEAPSFIGSHNIQRQFLAFRRCAALGGWSCCLLDAPSMCRCVSLCVALALPAALTAHTQMQKDD